jgi:hypothetical protein
VDFVPVLVDLALARKMVFWLLDKLNFLRCDESKVPPEALPEAFEIDFKTKGGLGWIAFCESEGRNMRSMGCLSLVVSIGFSSLHRPPPRSKLGKRNFP